MSLPFLVNLYSNGSSIKDLCNNSVQSIGNGIDANAQGVFGGKAIKFDGASCLDFANAIAVSGDELTVSFWYKCPTESNSSAITLYLGFDSKRYIILYSRRISDSKLYLTDGISSVYKTNVDINTDSWHHIAICKKGTTVAVFVDGKKKLNVSNFNIIDSPSAITGIQVGGSSDAGGFFTHSTIDNLCIFNKQLYTEDFTPPTHYFYKNNLLYLSTTGGRCTV